MRQKAIRIILSVIIAWAIGALLYYLALMYKYSQGDIYLYLLVGGPTVTIVGLVFIGEIPWIWGRLIKKETVYRKEVHDE